MTQTAILAPASPESVGISAERLARLDEAVNAEIERGKLPGGVAMITRRGKVAHFKAGDLLAPGHGFGLGFAVRLHDGVAPGAGSAGQYFWAGLAGTSFFIDPQEQLHAQFMIQQPGRRDYYRAVFRELVYAALVD